MLHPVPCNFSVGLAVGAIVGDLVTQPQSIPIDMHVVRVLPDAIHIQHPICDPLAHVGVGDGRRVGVGTELGVVAVLEELAIMLVV